MGILSLQYKLIKKGAEADIYLTKWYKKKAVSKIRNPKSYFHYKVDEYIRKKRTKREVNIINAAKNAEVRTPFIYFQDPSKGEIIMEYIEGKNVKDIISEKICLEMGRYAGLLHSKNIIHGDLTSANFIINKHQLVLIDFGLSFFSQRYEDKAVDLRLMKEILGSVHADIYEKAYKNFINGYSEVTNKKDLEIILKNIEEIENRGRYARID